MPARLTPGPEASPLYEEIGRAIREARQQAELSQEDLAYRVGLTRTSITNLERGRQQVPLHTLYDIAEAVGGDVKEWLPDGAPHRGPSEYGEDVERWTAQLTRSPRRASA